MILLSTCKPEKECFSRLRRYGNESARGISSVWEQKIVTPYFVGLAMTLHIIKIRVIARSPVLRDNRRDEAIHKND